MWEDKYEQAEEATVETAAKAYEPNLPWSMALKRGKFRVTDRQGGLIAECSNGMHAAMIVHSCNRYLAANEPTETPVAS